MGVGGRNLGGDKGAAAKLQIRHETNCLAAGKDHKTNRSRLETAHSLGRRRHRSEFCWGPHIFGVDFHDADLCRKIHFFGTKMLLGGGRKDDKAMAFYTIFLAIMSE